MSALRGIVAIAHADLRQRMRAARFWMVVAALGALMWWCFPAADADYLTVSMGEGMRARYSSAWVGMVAAMIHATALSLAGFYLVRGTIVRDLDSHAWQLLVATNMSRGGYLLAKWLSHLVVFATIVASGLALALLAQWLRGEDAVFDLVELAKPSLLLTLPALALTATLAVWFDLVPWLRRSAGNVLYFFLWAFLLGAGVAQADHAQPGLPWPGDPQGLLLAEHDLSRAWPAPAAQGEPPGLSVGKQVLEGRPPTLVDWRAWMLTPAHLATRASWIGFALIALLLAAPLLDRFAAARVRPASAGAAGARLAWLDALLSPLQHTGFGALLAAEWRLVLRPRPRAWWLVVLAAMCAQAFAPEKGVAIALLVAWLSCIDVFARLSLREASTRTGALVFTAPGMRWRLLGARALVALGLAWGVALPAMARLSVQVPMAAAATALAAASIAAWGLACGALLRNARPFELALVAACYTGAQGALVLNVLVDPGSTALGHAALLPLAAAALVVGWRRGIARTA